MLSRNKKPSMRALQASCFLQNDVTERPVPWQLCCLKHQVQGYSWVATEAHRSGAAAWSIRVLLARLGRSPCHPKGNRRMLSGCVLRQSRIASGLRHTHSVIPDVTRKQKCHQYMNFTLVCPPFIFFRTFTSFQNYLIHLMAYLAGFQDGGKMMVQSVGCGSDCMGSILCDPGQVV